jgi:hypothetical protein
MKTFFTPQKRITSFQPALLKIKMMVNFLACCDYNNDNRSVRLATELDPEICKVSIMMSFLLRGVIERRYEANAKDGRHLQSY